MAVYLYSCPACKKEFEIQKPMAQASQSEPCPDCRQAGSRVFTAPGISIKGAAVKFETPAGPCGAGSCGGCSDHGCECE